MCVCVCFFSLLPGGRRGRQEGHHHLRTVPPLEVLPQDSDALGARAGEEVQVSAMRSCQAVSCFLIALPSCQVGSDILPFVAMPSCQAGSYIFAARKLIFLLTSRFL